MKLLGLLSICTMGLVLLGASTFGPASKMVWDDSARAAALPDAPAPEGQAPLWSRGQQNLAISYDECVQRMTAALQTEGYRKDGNSGGNFVAGYKGVHTGVIICSPAPESKMLVQIVVASNGDGGGRERQCLQAQMEQPGASRCERPIEAGRPGSLVWQQVGTGDCSGGDVASTEGFTPDNKQAQEGRIAICWDGGRYNNLYAGSGRVFCTYKNSTPSQCSGGKYPGVMYRAVTGVP